ncbi:glycosyltransferase family 2 protein [Pilimelia columellifera]
MTAAAPTVSVVIPTVGRDTLGRAVAAALAQSRPPVEVLVVVDGDGPPPTFADPRARALPGHGAGPAAMRMTGARAAVGDLVAFCDDDDEWLPSKLSQQVAAYQAAPTRRPAVISLCRDVDAAGRTLFEPVPGGGLPAGAPLPHRLFRRCSLRQRTGLGGSSTILCDRELLLAEPLREDLALHEDWEWLLRVDRRPDAGVVIVEAPLVRYRVNPPGTSAGSPADGWRRSVAFAHAAGLDRRTLGDFLLTVSGPMAVADGQLGPALRIARDAVLRGRPGLPALSTFALLLVLPAPVRWRLGSWASRLLDRPTG